MTRIHRPLFFAALICVLLFTGPVEVSAQIRNIRSEPSAPEGRGPRSQSAGKTILIALAEAVLKVLCAENANCRNGYPPTETSEPDAREDQTALARGMTPGNARSTIQQRGFSFDSPLGWQSYENQSSVTVARPSEYINGNLLNGVILGLFDLNGASFESGNEKYVRGLISNNQYLKRVGWAESNVVNNVPCITTRMEGQSPQTQYFEKVVVYTCKRNTEKLFYVVTVNSGPNASQYEGENSRITQSINFR